MLVLQIKPKSNPGKKKTTQMFSMFRFDSDEGDVKIISV